jgi:hypothetical protein
MMRRLLVLLALVAATPAWSQATIMQGGTWSQGHVPTYTVQGGSNPVVQDSGPAGGGAYQGVSELLLTVVGSGTAPYANAGTGPYFTNFCDYDAPTTNATGYHYLCFSPNAQGGGLIAYGNGGGATALPLSFKVNGTTYNFPFSASGITGPGSSTVNHLAVWNNTTGSLLADANTGTNVLTALGNATNGAGGVLTTDGTASLTNKTYDTAGTGNVLKFSGVTVTGVTGTGAGVLATSPSLTTPNLGTPSVVTLTNATGLPIGGMTGLGSGTPTVASALAAATNGSGGLLTTDGTATLTNKTFDTGGTGNVFKFAGVTVSGVTGTGANVLATSPVLTTPNLGTPSILTLTNATGLPIAGITGLGSGTPTVASALAAVTNGTGGIVTSDGTSTLTNKTYDSGGTGNVFKFAGTQVTGVTGTGSAVLATSPTLVTPTLTTPTINTGTLSSPAFSGTATGSLTSAVVAGTTAGGNPSAGFLGEYFSSSVTGISLTTATPANLTNVALTAGDWDCAANAVYSPAGTTVVTNQYIWISTTSATLPASPNGGGYAVWNGTATGQTIGLTTAVMRINISSPTTVYLSVQSAFTVSTQTAAGFIGCRRMR